MKEIKERPEISELDPVPLYRSYGVRKKEGFFAHLNIVLARVIVTMILIVLAVGLGIALCATLYMLHALGVLIVGIAVFCFVYFGLLRVVRKRRKFLRRLKRICKKRGFELQFTRGFFDGLRRNTSGFDLIVKTDSCVFCARFFTCKKRNSQLIFEDEKNVTVRTNFIQSRIKTAYGLIDEKNVRTPYSFDDELPPSALPTTRALILNPVPHSIYKKDADGVVGATGSGENMFGYTVFTGSGFIETLLRG